MTNNELIKKLNIHKTSVIQADKLNINTIVSDILCTIEESDYLSKIYNEKIKIYDELRNNEEFQNAVEKYCSKIIEEFNAFPKFHLTLDAITPITENDTSIKYQLTNLYFYNVELIKDLYLDENKQNMIRAMLDVNYPLIFRNSFIYSEVYNTLFKKQEKIITNEQCKILTKNNSSYYMNRITKLMKSEILYSFHFFNTEQKRSAVQLIEQMKIASINIINEFIYCLKREIVYDIITKKDKQENSNSMQNIPIGFKDEYIEFMRLYKHTPEATYEKIAPMLNVSVGKLKQMAQNINNHPLISCNKIDKSIYKFEEVYKIKL